MTEFKPASELLTEDMLKMRFNEMVEKASRKAEFSVEINAEAPGDKTLIKYLLDKEDELNGLGYMLFQKTEHPYGMFRSLSTTVGVKVKW